MKKRGLSLFLALALCLTLLPAPAWAEEDTQEPNSGTTTEDVAEVVITVLGGTETTKRYADLLEAFYDADTSQATKVEVNLLQNGKTYTLDSEDAFPIEFQYTNGVEVIVDLNSCTLSRTVTDSTHGILWVEKGNVTLKNGTLDLTNSDDPEYSNPAQAIELKDNNNDNPTLTLEDMTIKVTGNGYAINAEGGTLNIKRGTYGEVRIHSAAVKLSGGSYTEVECYNDYANLLETGYIFTKQDGTYIDPSEMGTDSDDKIANIQNIQVIECDHNGAKFEKGTCTRCGAACEHTNLDENGVCDTCKQQMAAKVGERYFTTLAAAVKAANGGTVTLLADVAENITITDDTTVTIDLNGKTWEGMGTTWTGNQPVPLTVNGGSVTVQNGTLNQGGASDNANTAVIVNGGSLTVGEGMTIRGAVYAGEECRPAITVESGSLILAENTKLIYGMKVPSDKTLADYLPKNTAFAMDGSVIDGYVQEKIGKFTLTVAEHTHSFDENKACTCGYTCSEHHFEGGKCTACGYECTHPSATEADGKYTCDTCKQQMVVKVTKGDKITYYAERHNASNDETLWWLFNKALESDSTVTLLADNLVAWAYVSNGKQITLDLNGKTLEETSQGITVGRDNDTDTTSTNNKLIVTGTLGAGEVAKDNCYAFRTWEGGELNLKEVADGGKIGSIIADGGKVTTEDSTSDMKIGTLYIINGDTDISFRAGSFGKICFSGSDGGVMLGNLLAENSGCAFQNADGEFVSYNTVIDGSHAVENVTITDCPHDSITSGTCDYCNLDNLAAALIAADGTVTNYRFTDKSDAGAQILLALQAMQTSDNGKVKLFADCEYADKITWEDNKQGTIDLNGHSAAYTGTMNRDEGFLMLNSGTLTITDSSKDKTGSFAYVKVRSGASLIVDGAYVEWIIANESNTSVLLKPGTQFDNINLGSSGLRLFNCIESGSCVSGADLDTVGAYNKHTTIDRLPGTVTPPTDKNVSISYGSSVPDSFLPTVTLGDGVEASLTYEWLYRGSVSYSSPSDAPVTADDQSLDMICVITANKWGKSTWETAVTGYTLTVTQGQATVATAPADKNLTYTGSAQELVAAGAANGGEMQYSTDGKNWSATIPTGTDAKEYTVWYKAVGDSNHKDSEAQSLTVKIAPMQLSDTPYVVDKLPTITKGYDGTTEVKIHIDGFVKNGGSLSNAADRVPLTQGEDFDVVDALYDNANVGTGKYASMRFVMKNPNYAFASSNPSYVVYDSASITKANSSTLSKQNGTLTVAKGTSAAYTYGLSQLLPTLPAGRTYGAVSYTASWNGTQDACKSISIKDGVLTAEIDTTQGLGINSNIKVTVSSTNYDKFTLTINVKAVDQKLPQGEPTLSKDTLTYGDTLSEITLSGAMKDGDTAVAGTFAWTDGTVKPGTGSYAANWKFTPTDTAYAEVTGAAVITVKKATPTGAPKYTAINTSSKTLADAGLTVEDGTFSVPGSVAWELDDTTQVTANTAYKWVFTPNDTANYNTLEGTVTLWRRSSSGGGSSTTAKTETTTNPDGSITKTETKSDGTVIETTTYKDGSTTKTETKKDGSSITETKLSNGSTGTVKTDKNGQTTAEAKVSDKAVSDAKKSGEAVNIPAEVKAGEDSSSAPTVKIDLPSSAGETKIEIPVKDATSGTVAVIVKPDGTEEIVKDSVPTEDGIQLTVEGDVTVKIVNNAKNFTDTKGHWAQESIDFVSARGLVNGTSDSTFSPNAPTTRAQLWTILARQAGADLTGGANWYEKAQNWAKANGISDGTNPNGIITRAQMVTMLWRAAGSPEVSVANTFTDVPADSYYAEAVAWAVEHGITTGVGSGKFDPNGTCTRAQIATFLHRSYLSK